ncbi:MAG: ATP phosphoribosyltransferase regulatory subunit [Candidatus Cloacimonadaceae bacterium]
MISKLGIHQFQPDKVWKWKSLEARIARILSLNDYKEIRLSVLQDYQLVQQGINALSQVNTAFPTADNIVNLLANCGEESLFSLRPEGTISVLHHCAELIKPQEIKRYYYLSTMFRKDAQGNPQEYHQLGVELLGSDSVMSDNEVISLGLKILHNLGLKGARLELSSLGCDNCQLEYSAAPAADKDTEELQHLCPSCHYKLLQIMKVQANLAHQYRMEKQLVRNFAYYNGTVFHFILPTREGDLLLGGGGRYDQLSRAITGKKIPAVGFYLDIDALFEQMDSRQLFQYQNKEFSVYIASQSEELEMMMLQIAQELQENNIKTVLSADKHSLEDDTLLAKKSGSELMIIIREENVREGKVLLRKMNKEHQDYVGLSNIVDEILLARKSLNKD